MIVIIGAGISGLSAARRMMSKRESDERAQRECLVLEKEPVPGGLSTQYRSGDYWFDYSGHYFHFLNKADIKQHLLRFCSFKTFNRKSKTFMLDRYIPFPVQMHLGHLPATVKNRALKEILDTNPQSHDHFDNLGAFLRAHFGTTLFESFFQPFLGKYYHADLGELASSMDKGSIPVPDKESVIQGARGKTFSGVGYNPVFYYTVPSLRHFIANYSAPVADRIRFDSEVTSVDPLARRVTAGGKTFQYDSLVSTMPLNRLLEILEPGLDNLPDPRQLRHVSTLLVNVILERKHRRFHWAYLPEKRFPFYRVGYYPVHPYPACYMERNFTPAWAVREPHRDRQMREIKEIGELVADPEKRRRAVIPTLKGLGVIRKESELVHCDARIIPVSYILFDRGWERTVPPLLQRLREQGIYSIGRFGSWNYTSMSDDIKSALACADQLNI